VRELRNSIEQAVLLADSDEIHALDLGPKSNQQEPSDKPSHEQTDLNLVRSEQHLIDLALQRSSGNVTQAARLLGISRDTLRYRLERVDPPAPAQGPRSG
jgi:DNA-binding NtrC family response regulator